jgi:hypothetical protein
MRKGLGRTCYNSPNSAAWEELRHSTLARATAIFAQISDKDYLLV